jgi:prevent-host-death family protein
MNQTAMVSELKAKLSGYLAQVRRGATVTVCDRQTPIARLVPFDGDAGGLEVREPTDASSLPAAPGVTLRKPIDVVTLLRADRDQR